MSIAALIAAYDADAVGLRALRPLAGVTVLEHQLRRLAAIDVRRIQLLLEAWPAALGPALQRLRADGIAVDTATSIADAAERFGGEPCVLLLAEGCLPDEASLARLAAAVPPSILVLPDDTTTQAFERVDADCRWAGAALLDGRAIVDTAAMVGDWDPVSTLLRRAIQEDATRIPIEGDVPLLAGHPDVLAGAEARLLAQSRGRPRGWAVRFIETPPVDALLLQAFAHGVEPLWPGAAAAVLATVGGLLALAGLPALGLACLLPTGILLRIAARLAIVQARRLPRARLLRAARKTGLALGALGLGLTLRRADLQWGWPLLAVLTIAAFVLRNRLRPLLARTDEPPAWIATVTAMPWTLLPFAIAGRWGAGLAVATAYALGSLAWLLWRVGENPTE